MAPVDSTILARLREKREALGVKKTVVLPIPGYEGELAVRYAWKPYEELARRGQALQKVKDPTRRDLWAAADTLIQLCVEVVIPSEESEDGWRGLAEDGDEPIRFDDRLADALGFDADSARATVFGVFAANDYAVLNAALQLSAWLQDATQEVDADFSGS
jgi:hypothetical protein